jgi:hypothetical protein
MSHIPYKLALVRRDELLREAADRRLAAESDSERPGSARATGVRRPHRLSRLEWRFRVTGRTR